MPNIRIALIALIAFSLFACKHKIVNNPPASANADTIKPTIITKPLTTAAIKNNIPTYVNYPADTIYPAKILTADGIFHEDEVDSKADTYAWKGIFLTDSNGYVSDTQLKLSRAYDAVLDAEGEKTGWAVNLNNKDTSILLISGLTDLPNHSFQPIRLKHEQLLPGQQEHFICNGVQYTLYATGNSKLESAKSKTFVVTNYKLFIKANINNTQFNQLLISIESFDDAMTTLLFAGDIDNDGRPDFIIDTTHHYNAVIPTLYLSKPANKGQLLKIMGMHTSVGC